MAKTLRSADKVFQDITKFFGRSVEAVKDEAINIAKSLTPVRTGRARRGWKKRDKFKLGKNRLTLLENRVPYIGVLDKRNPIIRPATDRAVYMTRRSNK